MAWLIPISFLPPALPAKMSKLAGSLGRTLVMRMQELMHLGSYLIFLYPHDVHCSQAGIGVVEGSHWSGVNLTQPIQVRVPVWTYPNSLRAQALVLRSGKETPQISTVNYSKLMQLVQTTMLIKSDLLAQGDLSLHLLQLTLPAQLLRPCQPILLFQAHAGLGSTPSSAATVGPVSSAGSGNAPHSDTCQHSQVCWFRQHYQLRLPCHHYHLN